MKIFAKSILAIAAAIAVSAAVAEPIKQSKADKILAGMKEVRPDIPFGEVFESPIDGVYRVPVGSQNLYVSGDGKHFIAGDLLSVTSDGFVDPLEADRAKARLGLIQSIDVKSQIVYAAKGETRAYINVFTDIDCGYCRKLHRLMDEMNAEGIEVRYLAFPRAGLNSESYNKIATAWCSDNPQEALTALKSNQAVPNNVCDGNPVAEHYALAAALGVTGTPAIALEDGRLIPGYMPTNDLLKALKLESIRGDSSKASSSAK